MISTSERILGIEFRKQSRNLSVVHFSAALPLVQYDVYLRLLAFYHNNLWLQPVTSETGEI